MAAQTYQDVLADSVITLGECPSGRPDLGQVGKNSECTTVFFPGCAMINFLPSLVDAVFETLQTQFSDCGISMLCCGEILDFEPNGEEAKQIHEYKLAQILEQKSITRIIAACPNCARALRRIKSASPALGTLEISPLPQVLYDAGLRISAEAIQQVSPSGSAKVCIHDSCPDRETQEFAAGVRALFPHETICEMANNRARSLCCGSPQRGLGKTEVAEKMVQKREQQALDTGADIIVTTCVNCAKQLATLKAEHLVVAHYLELLYDISVSWKELAPYMQLRFLLEEFKGTREFCDMSGPAQSEQDK